MPRATGNQRRREVCGSTVPVGEGSKASLSLTATLLNYCAVSPIWHQWKFSLPADSLPSAYDYQSTVNTPWMLKIRNAPKGCLLGAITGSMERKSLLSHLAWVSKFSQNSGRECSDKHYSLIFFFFPSPWCFFSTHSQQPWKLREWQMAIGKTWVSRKSAEMLYSTDKAKKGEMKTETK